jgi:HAMP domain-containing protein
MNWFLPVTLVLLASILVAAVHYMFTRWLARQSEPVRSDSQSDTDSSAN